MPRQARTVELNLHKIEDIAAHYSNDYIIDQKAAVKSKPIKAHLQLCGAQYPILFCGEGGDLPEIIFVGAIQCFDDTYWNDAAVCTAIEQHWNVGNNLTGLGVDKGDQRQWCRRSETICVVARHGSSMFVGDLFDGWGEVRWIIGVDKARARKIQCLV